MKKTKILTLDNIMETLQVLEYENYSRCYNFMWKMSDGKLINIKDMKDSHLNNTIRLVIKNMVTNPNLINSVNKKD